MSSTEVLFAVSASVAILAGAVMVGTRRPSRSLKAWTICVIAVGVGEILLWAPAVIVVQILGMFVSIVLGTRTLAKLPQEASCGLSWWQLVGLLSGIGFFLFVLLGTWTRQYLQTGVELTQDSDFGQMATVLSALLHQNSSFLLLMAVFMVVTSGLLVHIFFITKPRSK